MVPYEISKETARRFVFGRQGLWPGRRWSGKPGTAKAVRTIEAVQLDPLNVVARSHDIVLWSRVNNYQPAYLDQLLYQDRQFFDYGGSLFVYPIQELPFWRLHMTRRENEEHRQNYMRDNHALLEEVKAELRKRGPLGNRDFTDRKQVNSYRGRKDSALALYHLWLTGELMVHHRTRFERIYDFRKNIVAESLAKAAPSQAAEGYFARKTVALYGLISERSWRNGVAGFIHRPVSQAEARHWLDRLLSEEVFSTVRQEGSKENWLILSEDLPLLKTVAAGGTPKSWQPLTTSTDEEINFLAPLDIVSARGRATSLFDFEYVWEVYKPANTRRWGYYTLPILYGDKLVARFDPKLERASDSLLINGFWMECEALAEDHGFAKAFAQGLKRFGWFLGANKLDLNSIQPPGLLAEIGARLEDSFKILRTE